VQFRNRDDARHFLPVFVMNRGKRRRKGRLGSRSRSIQKLCELKMAQLFRAVRTSAKKFRSLRKLEPSMFLLAFRFRSRLRFTMGGTVVCSEVRAFRGPYASSFISQSGRILFLNTCQQILSTSTTSLLSLFASSSNSLRPSDGFVHISESILHSEAVL
jgi:hypothetical protein